MTVNPLSNQRLLAFLSDADSADAVRAIEGAQVESGDVATATQFLKTHPSPQTLLVDIPSAEAAPALLDALAEMVNPHTRVIVSGKVDTLRFYQWLLEIGIHDYLLQPFTAAQLNASLAKHSGGAAPVVSAAPQLKKLVAVMGARGGVGTTTIATNLAAIFAVEQQVATALVDLDVHFGSVALSLDLEPGRGMRDALEKPERVDGLFLDRVMVKPFAGLGILSAEDPLQEMLVPQANAGPVLFTALAEKFGIIVADVPRQINPLTRHVLAHADTVIIVAEPHLIDLRDALRIKDYLVEQLKRPAPLLLLNREGLSGKQELPTKDFTKHFGAAPVAHIKLLPEAYAANAQGELLMANPKMKSALAPLRALAAQISGVDAGSEPEETSRRGRIKRRKEQA